MQRLVGEPPGERPVAAIAGLDRLLRLAAGVGRRAFYADMEPRVSDLRHCSRFCKRALKKSLTPPTDC
jgi:hypothetical protein